MRIFIAALAFCAIAAAQAPMSAPSKVTVNVVPGLGALRELGQIPADRLAQLRKLADFTVNLDEFRSSVMAGIRGNSGLLRAELQQTGLSAERISDFLDAFNQGIQSRLGDVANNDYLVRLLDKAYDDGQVAQLLAFYQSPIGQQLAKMDSVVREDDGAHMQAAMSKLAANVAHDVSGSFAELNKDTAPPPAGELPRPSKVDNTLYPPVAQAQSDLAAAEKRAAASGHRVLVVFGANWCYDCHVLDAALGSPDFAQLVTSYERVEVNVGDTGQDNLDLAKRIGVDISKGVPALAVLDGQGKVLVAQAQGEFQDTRTLQADTLKTFLQTWRPKK